MTAEPQDKLTIETPEIIPLEYPLAGIGSRFLAVAVDYLIQGIAGLVLVVASETASPIVKPALHRSGMWFFAILAIVSFLIQFGYFAGFEAWWNGQTPGKRYFHLRVIKDSGRPISAYDSVARNFLRIVDIVPGIYGVGVISMLFSSKNKRIGDYVAGTVVVHERPLATEAKIGGAFNPLAAVVAPEVPLVAPEEFQLIEAFLLRREQLAPAVRAQLARRIALRVAARMKIPPEADSESMIEKLARDYRERGGFGKV